MTKTTVWQRQNTRQSGPNEGMCLSSLPSFRHLLLTSLKTAPLGGTRRWGGDERDSRGPPPPPPPPGGGYDDRDRGRPAYDSRGPPGGGGGGYDSRPPPQVFDPRADPRGGGGGYDSRDSRGPPPGAGYDRGPPGGGYESRGPPTGPPPSMGGYDSRDSRGPPPSQGRYDQPPPPPPPMDAPGGERKRKSRWGSEKVDSGNSMPTAITGGVNSRDLDSYACSFLFSLLSLKILGLLTTSMDFFLVQLRLDEISRALRTGLVVPPDGSRSPSPPPTYDSHGRRTNTREVRYKKKLEDERIHLVDRQMKLDPNFKPPTEYLMAKRQSGGRPQDKVYIPVKEFPEINFFGLLVGPRGNSLKKMERESGAKISIRGKGSVKEGKGRPGGGFEDDENEELHCLVMGETEEKVQRCVKLINSVIEIVSFLSFFFFFSTIHAFFNFHFFIQIGCFRSRRTKRSQTKSTS